MTTRVEAYLAHLDRVSGGAEPRFVPIEPAGGSPHRITSIAYRDLPEPGMLTALTYGLSLADHPEWTLGRPELCLSVRSDDDRWAWAVGNLASSLVHECPFAYGDTVTIGRPIARDTAMSAFVVFAPAVLDPADHLNVLAAPPGAGPQDVVNIAGVYPIHESERQLIRTHGLESFLTLARDLDDPGRPPVA